MEQTCIIRDLLNWLESHLDQPLSLDDVAAKAGYSKWHMQRMFKDITGSAIGSYIRARRLSKTAVALRLTNRPILDIALQYRFDSQQTFTRAFKKQFVQTPALYRRAEDWHTSGICPPIRLGDDSLPQPDFVYWPEQCLTRLTLNHPTTLEQTSTSNTDLLSQLEQQNITKIQQISPLYGLHYSSFNPEKEDEQQVFYTTAIEQHPTSANSRDGHSIVLQGGEYVLFDYDGPTEGLQNFILTLYGTCLPLLKLTRRKGHDIKRFYAQNQQNIQSTSLIKCEYLIPIRR